MKNRIVLWGILIVLGLSTMACVTMIPKKTAPEDCLVLIRTTVKNETDWADARVYKFYFSDHIRPQEVDDGKNSFVAVRINKPGVMLIKLHSEISQLRGNYSGDPTNQDTDMDLPYAAGKVLIADFAFVRKVVKTGPDKFMTYADFKKISPEEQASLRELAIAQFQKNSDWDF